jgi:peptidyl-prolyl cis-trans isomerase B (cyclophilin B)
MLERVQRSVVAATLVVAVVLPGNWVGVALGADKAPAGESTTKQGPRAIIKTKLGEMEIKFFPDVAPKHVENFIKLAKDGFYNGTIFHRVIPGFRRSQHQGPGQEGHVWIGRSRTQREG